ncbi:MAG: 23S rRNA (uracil(1939)-C(5))-methyltransferase RlmD [Saprospirales bacterium]|nr:23S rRNA (uracil(1939)-C(5))-methyltransferase RlmD [Saprospirales bacterium]
MTRKSKSFIAPAVPIHGVADRGKGVGRTPDGLVLFVEGAVPGDVVDVFVQKKKGGFGEGRIERLLHASPERTEPFCQHFSVCGGCKWQHLQYEAQLQHKHQTVLDAFQRIAKVPVEEFLPILGAPETTYYRNKLEFAFSHKRWLLPDEMPPAPESPPDSEPATSDLEHTPAWPGLGFHRAGAFDKVVDIHHCWLQADPSNAIRNAARATALEQGLPFYDMRRHQGFLRNLMIRRTTTGEVMLLLSFAYPDDALLRAYLDALLTQFPGQITTLVYCINPKLNDTVFDLDMINYYGPGFVVEQLGDLRFKIGPKSFFQTNSVQAKNLYETVVQFAGLSGTENVYDLYTGAGTIALYVARFCKQVVGIEEIPEAIADAGENRALNGIENAVFYAGDVKNVLTPALIEQHGKPDLIITDPPRAGMHEKAVRFLLELAAPRIVYVSCNPATQARDVQLLAERYDVLKVQPVDMFPHTQHIENVALLEKRKD